jgi:hypothetical protein
MAAQVWDAVLVPGGGLRPDGSLPPWVVRRLDRAVEVRSDAYVLPMSRGTVHKPPPLDDRGFPVGEADACAAHLRGRGVPDDRILVESFSVDTIGNAYFARVVHTDPMGLRRLHVVTSRFHRERTEAVFRWVYGLDVDGYGLSFESVPDDGIGPAALAARVEKERAGLAALRSTIERTRTLAALHRWLFFEHAAYRGIRPAPTEGPALRTY